LVKVLQALRDKGFSHQQDNKTARVSRLWIVGWFLK